MAVEKGVFALVGDLVGSRRTDDRTRVHARLMDALAGVNDAVPHLQPLEPTVGDEFQGVYSSLGDAVTASLLVRLELSPLADARCGIGYGDLTVFEADRSPILQDGPAWWAARGAIDEVAARANRPRWEYLRTWFEPWHAEPDDRSGDAGSASAVPSEADASPPTGPVNAFLTCRDHMVSRLKLDALQLLKLSLLGTTQADMGAALGISQPAVSQRLAGAGINALKDAHDLMREEWS